MIVASVTHTLPNSFPLLHCEQLRFSRILNLEENTDHNTAPDILRDLPRPPSALCRGLTINVSAWAPVWSQESEYFAKMKTRFSSEKYSFLLERQKF